MDIIRRSTPQDDQLLAALYQACRLEADWLPAEAETRADFAADSAGELVLVALDGAGQLLGLVSVWEPQSFVHHLYVRAAARGQGVGPALLAALEGQVPRPWRLKCNEANRRALEFYLSRGWREVGRGDGSEGPYLVLELGPGA